MLVSSFTNVRTAKPCCGRKPGTAVCFAPTGPSSVHPSNRRRMSADAADRFPRANPSEVKFQEPCRIGGTRGNNPEAARAPGPFQAIGSSQGEGCKRESNAPVLHLDCRGGRRLAGNLKESPIRVPVEARGAGGGTKVKVPTNREATWRTPMVDPRMR